MKGGEHKPMTNEEFKQIVLQYERLVFTICFQLVRDYHEAQNLTQETFVSAYKHIDNCSKDSYKPWLCRIASNKAKDFLRSAYARHTVLEGEDSAFDKQDVLGQPEKKYIEKESAQTIESIIRSLKEPYLKVSVMRFIEMKSVDEISKALDRPPKTVQTQLLRAKKFIGEKLQNMENTKRGV